jgi:multidrug efflux pump subunit AcrA (membrane-fusion protein)
VKMKERILGRGALVVAVVALIIAGYSIAIAETDPDPAAQVPQPVPVAQPAPAAQATPATGQAAATNVRFESRERIFCADTSAGVVLARSTGQALPAREDLGL